jgi:transcriptional regulator with XRE-family HTH domain
MTTVERPADRGRRRGRIALGRVVEDGRAARIAAGLSQREVGRALKCSHARIGRLERGEFVPDVEVLAAYCAVVGLDLSLRAYPAGDALRDRAQRRLLERLRAQLHPSLTWRTEVGLPIHGDLRAWDAEIRGRDPRPWRARVEAETRVSDGQALERKLALKVRDDPGGHLVLLAADTRTNRAALATLRSGLHDMLPCSPRELLAALRQGREPPGSGILLM